MRPARFTTVIVHGPARSNKTRAAELLRRHFGMRRIVDEWDGRSRLPAGTLALTQEPPAALKRPNRLVLSAADAIAQAEASMARVPRLRFAPITYRIHNRIIGHEPVSGYAIELPAPFAGLRFCVRETPWRWTIDHYDSGMGFGGPVAAIGADAAAIEECRRWAFNRTSRNRCAESLLRYLHHLVGTGQLRPLFDRHGYGWCADEALDVMAAHWGRFKDDEHKFSAMADTHGKHWHDVLDQLREREAYYSMQRDWQAVALQVGTPVI